MVQPPGRLEVALQGPILVVVPPGTGLLREPGPMADHPLDQIIRHVQPVLGPPVPGSVVAQPERQGRAHRGQEQGGVGPTARAGGEHGDGQGQLQDGRQPQEPPGQAHQLDDLRLQHAAVELADPRATGLVVVQRQGPEEESALEQGPRPDRERAAHRGQGEAAGDGR